MPEPVGQAVFLSYASQDAEAARRLCQDLRSGGVEVWFDTDGGLETGDEWDAKIRRQIRECLLFIPLISANTQARPEGYFRIEWDLAAQRARGIATGVPFLLPVLIDDTGQAEALVPDRFLAVQWTKIPGGTMTPEVRQRLLRLWSHRCAWQQHAAATPAHEAPATASRPAPRGWRRPALLLAGLAAALILAAVWFRPAAVPGPPTSPASSALPAPGEHPPGPTSIAVLPFVNLGPAQGDEHLCDGLTVEILSTLTRIPGLRVPAQASSFVFKGRQEEPRRVGEKLQVKYLLAGTVLRAGSRLRITTELLKAADGFQLWSEKFDRSLDDIFQVQTEIARAIVARLGGTVARGVPIPTSRRLTRNIEAYELMLRATHHFEKITEAGYRDAIEGYRRALARQPDYAPAYAGLAAAYFWRGYFSFAAPQADLAEMRAAADRAIELDVMLPDAHLTQAMLAFYVERNWPDAEKAFRRALELEPAFVYSHLLYSLFLSALRRHPEAIAETRLMRELDPLSVLTRSCETWVHYYAREYERTRALSAELIALEPNFLWAYNQQAWALFRTGRTQEAIALAEKAAPLSPIAFGDLGFMYGRTGRRDDARRVHDELLTLRARRYVPAWAMAWVCDGLGEREQQDVWMRRAIADREGGVVLLNVVADDLTRTHPQFPAWLKELGLGP